MKPIFWHVCAYRPGSRCFTAMPRWVCGTLTVSIGGIMGPVERTGFPPIQRYHLVGPAHREISFPSRSPSTHICHLCSCTQTAGSVGLSKARQWKDKHVVMNMGNLQNFNPFSCIKFITPVIFNKEYLYQCLHSQSTMISFKIGKKKI